jgi:hypothetical protein
MKAILAILACLCCAAYAQDAVTIPKSRLQELEKKEAELEALKAATARPAAGQPSQKESLSTRPEAVSAPLSAPPPPAPSPSRDVSSLAPITADEVISADDLAADYRSDPAAANERYRKHRFLVRGEIVEFEKPMFTRDYRMVLRTSDRDWSVVCQFGMPDNYRTVFKAKSGSELVATRSDQAQFIVARKGQTAVIAGQCSGLKGSAVKLSACELKSLH